MCSVIFVLADDRKNALFLALHRECLMHFHTLTGGSLKFASSSPTRGKHGCLRAAELPARSAQSAEDRNMLASFSKKKGATVYVEKNVVATARISLQKMLSKCKDDVRNN